MACLSGGPDRKGGRWLASRELSQSSRGADGAKVLWQIKWERVKGDWVKMKLLKEGDEKNRREIEDTQNLRRNHFFNKI